MGVGARRSSGIGFLAAGVRKLASGSDCQAAVVRQRVVEDTEVGRFAVVGAMNR